MITTIISVLIALFVGLVIGYFGVKKGLKKQNELIVANSKKEAEIIIKEANSKGEVIKNNKILQAKEKFLSLKSKHDSYVSNSKNKVVEVEKKIRRKESIVSSELDKIKRIKEEAKSVRKKLEQKLENNSKKEEKLKKSHIEHIEKLEKISGLSAEQAREELVKNLVDEAKTESISHIQKITEEAHLTAKEQAKKIVIQTIQRVAAEQAIENSVSVFNIESDSVKGRIIGREGRNIRAFEAATGVELIVDDTPDAIVISCFDPVRREIAKIALNKLVIDGRIHPAKIEEIVRKTEKNINDEIIEVGKKTIIELDIHGLHPELVKLVGRMKYRSSYGQNLLRHSKEVANLCAIMASELGLNPKVAKRAGLLHDIGKVPDTESELPHALLGMKWAEKYGEKPDVCNAIGAHHDEIEMKYMMSPIIQVCDAISGARPGARRQVLESYYQRIRDLENLANDFDGVMKSFAIQAGRELRVLVESESVDDKKSAQLSYDISQKIQNEMSFPGQVKVTVIREVRSVNIAR